MNMKLHIAIHTYMLQWTGQHIETFTYYGDLNQNELQCKSAIPSKLSYFNQIYCVNHVDNKSLRSELNSNDVDTITNICV